MNSATLARLSAILVLSTGTFSAALANDPIQSERLTPAIMTYLDLLLCATTAQEFLQDEVSAQEFRNMAFKVEDAAMAAGWSDDVVNSIIAKVQEGYAELEITKGETRESYQLRHFSGDRCQRQMASGRNFLAGGLPEP